MRRLRLAAAALLGGLAMASAANAFIFLEIDSSGQLFDFNTALTKNNFTAVGTESIVMEGLGQLGTVIYGETAAGQLYTITSAGVETAIPGGPHLGGATSFVDFGSTGGLYAIGNNGVLYQINRTNGDATAVGSGLGLTGTLGSHTDTIGSGKKPTVEVMGMSTGSSTLFLDDGNTIYAVDLNPADGSNYGKAIAIGTFSGTPTNYAGLMYATAAQIALAGGNGTAGFYGGSNDISGPNSHTGVVGFTINGSSPNESWVASFLQATDPNNAHASQFWGMVFGFLAPDVPEPSEWALMLVGVGAVGGALRARRRKATAEA